MSFLFEFGNDRTKFILIRDTIKANGENVLRGIVKHFAKKAADIHMIVSNRPYNDWLNKLDIPLKCFQVYDFFKIGWNSDRKNDLDLLLEKDYSVGSIVVFESLSTLLYHFSFEKVYNCIKKLLLNSTVQVLGLIHIDGHNTGTDCWLQRLATCTITNSWCNGYFFHCFLSGVPNEYATRTCKYEVDENLEINLIEEVRPNLVVQDTVVPNIPDMNLPFNLSLKKSEQDDRSKLLLPYIKSGQQASQVIDTDLEEDPDDDLDV